MRTAFNGFHLYILESCTARWRADLSHWQLDDQVEAAFRGVLRGVAGEFSRTSSHQLHVFKNSLQHHFLIIRVAIKGRPRALGRFLNTKC